MPTGANDAGYVYVFTTVKHWRLMWETNPAEVGGIKTINSKIRWNKIKVIKKQHFTLLGRLCKWFYNWQNRVMLPFLCFLNGHTCVVFLKRCRFSWWIGYKTHWGKANIKYSGSQCCLHSQKWHLFLFLCPTKSVYPTRSFESWIYQPSYYINKGEKMIPYKCWCHL